MKALTLGSLFDGSGGFPLGGLLCGITPVWASEIEPFPIRVTTKRLPQMQHLGDVSKIDGAKIPPVDIITFGSPCTDMSVAGKRAGLDGSQSVLFYEAIRIVREMREATNGAYPRYIVWENVPGAFSSHGGADFKAVLESVVQIVCPEAEVPAPPNGKWSYADVLLGDGWSVAYRTVDAQYFGVAQRRRRIYLVADFAGERAGEILFECESVSGNTAPGFSAGQGTTRDAGSCAPGAVGFEQGALAPNRERAENEQDEAPCSSAGDDQATVAYGISADGSNAMRSGNPRSGIYVAATARTIDANGGNPGCNQGGIAIVEPLMVEMTSTKNTVVENGISPTLTARMGTGGNQVNCVAFSQNQRSEVRDLNDCAGALAAAPGAKQQTYVAAFKYGNSAAARSIGYEEERSPTLSGTAGGNQTPVICLQGSMLGREQQNGPRGDGVNEDVCFTLNTVDRHAVAVEQSETYAMTTGCYSQVVKGCSPTLMSRDYKDAPIVTQPASFYPQQKAEGQCFRQDGQANTLVNGTNPGYQNGVVDPDYIVRRLTPTECARLQGFPDWWCADLGTETPTDTEIDWWADVFETHRKVMGTSQRPRSRAQIVKWLRDPHSDAAEYKLWGNGVALPCVIFVLSGIVKENA